MSNNNENKISNLIRQFKYIEANKPYNELKQFTLDLIEECYVTFYVGDNWGLGDLAAIRYKIKRAFEIIDRRYEIDREQLGELQNVVQSLMKEIQGEKNKELKPMNPSSIIGKCEVKDDLNTYFYDPITKNVTDQGKNYVGKGKIVGGNLLIDREVPEDTRSIWQKIGLEIEQDALDHVNSHDEIKELVKTAKIYVKNDLKDQKAAEIIKEQHKTIDQLLKDIETLKSQIK